MISSFFIALRDKVKRIFQNFKKEERTKVCQNFHYL